ncbi:MAG: 1-acyl-sn-glycerol-3-phosphate acyltransferase [Eggerthellaceae bacterium]|nr:1-acyl-sn-glycerol-3-phosphate acyltransferase [Eggerthellaceae bacterium]
MHLITPYKDMWDMPLGGDSEDKQAPHWTGNLIWAIIMPLFKLLFRYSIAGRENIRPFKDVSGFVLVCNHTSFIDVACIYFACRPSQWVRLMGRDTLFDNGHGFVGQLLSRVGGFPVKRDSADRQAIKRATKMLKTKQIVGILPEGTRRGKGGLPPELHSGAAFIAKMGQVPIIPMTVRNAEYVKQKGKRVHFPKITAEFGKPIVVGDFDFLPKEKRMEGCTWYAMRQCFSLSRNKPAEDIDMKELFPDTFDYTQMFEEHPIPEHTTEELVWAIRQENRKK